MFEGIFTSLITPFNEENKVDLERLNNLLFYLMIRSMDFLF